MFTVNPDFSSRPRLGEKHLTDDWSGQSDDKILKECPIEEPSDAGHFRYPSQGLRGIWTYSFYTGNKNEYKPAKSEAVLGEHPYQTTPDRDVCENHDYDVAVPSAERYTEEVYTYVCQYCEQEISDIIDEPPFLLIRNSH